MIVGAVTLYVVKALHPSTQVLISVVQVYSLNQNKNNRISDQTNKLKRFDKGFGSGFSLDKL